MVIQAECLLATGRCLAAMHRRYQLTQDRHEDRKQTFNLALAATLWGDSKEHDALIDAAA